MNSSSTQSKYESVIGLEVHAQLLTKSKMFCSCSAAYGGEPNTQVCPVCLGLPGALPVANQKAVEAAVKMGLATRCSIANKSVFARKNYFYPDCPKNYQISQFELPLCEHGSITINDGQKTVGITRIHLEEDAGKLLHEEHADFSHVDMNRVGVPLIEIVSEPDMRTPQEASAYLQKLRTLLRYLEICDGNMEEGSLRCDVNISLRRQGDTELGTKAEIKNLNSFKSAERAIEFEFKRQSELLDRGDRVVQETLLWDASQGRAVLMRSKEESHDYRYFPEPDLLVLDAPDELIERAREELPELPDARAKRFESELGLPSYDAHVLTASREIAAYYEQTAKKLRDPKAASNWVMGEVMRELNDRKIDVTEFKVSPGRLADLVSELKSGKINMPTAKDVLRDMAETGQSAADIISAKGLQQISDEGELESIVADIVDKHPEEVSRYLGGADKLLQFFVGQVMKATRGKAHPQKAAEAIQQQLAKKK